MTDADAATPRHLVVMGVAGAGKSTVAKRLANDLGLELAEGDDFHPRSNVEKMSAGHSLTDEDRWPWLEELAEWTAERRESGQGTVVTCSALRRAYRDVLRRPDAETFFVHLHGSEEMLRGRMAGRDHFMPASLLHAQFETLEQLQEDEAGVVVDIVASVDEVVERVEAALRL